MKTQKIKDITIQIKLLMRKTINNLKTKKTYPPT